MQDRNAYQLHAQVRAARRQHYAQANAAQKHCVPTWIKGLLIAACIGLGGALTAPKAHAAGMTTSDAWTGPDKTKHLIVGASIGLAAGALSDSWAAGAAAGCAVGVAKEINDMRSPGHTPSYKDAVVTCLGAAIGAKLGVMIAPVPGGVFVGKSWSW
jgi:uncharacterized protein YfiM (DUF2279 family)